MHWRVRYLIREALRNALMTPRGRVALLAGGLLAVLGVVLLRADLSMFQAGQESRYMRGAQVFTLTAPRDESTLLLDRSSCERIAKDPRVARAGVIEDRGTEYAPQLARRARIVAASASLVPEAYQTDAAIGEHISPGDSTVNIRIGQHTLQAQTLPALPDGVNLNGAVVVPLAPQDRWVAACVVSAWPGADLAVLAASAASAVRTRGGTAPAVLFADRDPEDHVRAYVSRATPTVVVGIGLLAGLLLAVLVRTRRAEFGVYRLAGTTRRELAVIITAECALTAGTFALSGLLGAVATTGWSETTASEAVVLVVAALVAFAAGSILGLLQIFGDPTRMLADR